jgi:hypothetical protein
LLYSFKSLQSGMPMGIFKRAGQLDDTRTTLTYRTISTPSRSKAGSDATELTSDDGISNRSCEDNPRSHLRSITLRAQIARDVSVGGARGTRDVAHIRGGQLQSAASSTDIEKCRKQLDTIPAQPAHHCVKQP